MTTDKAAANDRRFKPDDINDAETVWNGAESVMAMLRNARSDKDINDAGTVFHQHGTTGVTTDAEAGQSLDPEGRFRILRRLGEGGMGSVYLCEDTKLGRRVAVKKPRKPTVSNAGLFSTLVREAQSLARLTHPNIVDVWELNDDPVDSFIVMEYLAGGSLADLLNRTGPLKLNRAYAILRQVCEGLQYAHELGVVHRDVKPSNILFTGDGTPKLGDFGLALPAPTPSGSEGAPAGGSPAYMAPEQRTGTDTLDQRADVYGLGATLYRMLVGAPPGKAESAPLSAPLNDFFARALAPDPSARITTVGTFMDELSNLVDLPDRAPATAIPLSDQDDIPAVQVTSIDQVLTLRDIVSPIADVDFFIDLRASDKRYDEATIASVIKGANYQNEIAKYEELKSRASHDLEMLKKQGKRAKKHLAGLELSAIWKNPGHPPTKPFFGSSDSAEEHAIFQQQLDSYRLAQRHYEAIRDEIAEAKQQYRTTTRLYDQKSHDFEQFIRQQEAQVRAALDLDILVFLSEITRRADRSISYDGHYFEGFVLVYFAKKAYLLLRDYITGADSKYKATDIHDKLEDEFNSRIFAHKESVRDGLELAARCCIEEIMMQDDRRAIDSLLEQIPAQACAEYLSQAEDLLAQPIKLDFPFDPEAAVDPANANALREYLKRRDGEVRELSARMIDLVRVTEPVVNALASIQSVCEAVLSKMIGKEREEKQREQDLSFILSVFDEKENDQVLMKYSRWLKGVEQQIDKEYDIHVQHLGNGAITKKGVVQDAVELVRESGRWQPLTCAGKLEDHKNQLAVSLQRLRDKTEFAFSLSNVKSTQEEEPNVKGKKLKRAVYRQLISDGLQAGWSIEEINEAITPYVPRSLVVSVLAVGSALGLLTAGLTIFVIDEIERHSEGAAGEGPQAFGSSRIEVNPAKRRTQEPLQDLTSGDSASERLLRLDKGQINQIQRRLKTVGHNPGPVDGDLGPRTRNAIRSYQRTFGGQATGYLNEALRSALKSESQLGLNPQRRAQVQRWLKDTGYNPGPADGAFGPATREAIRSYQRSLGAEATGCLNRETFTALRADAEPVKRN